MVEDCLGIVFDTEEVMKTWLEMLISCQMGGRSIEGIYIFSFFHLFFLFQKKTLQNTHWYLLYHICYFDLLSFDETFWREKISTGCILKTKWLLKKMKIVIKRENLCAFENANFRQLFVLEGS